MKKLLLAGVGVLALGIATASAADLPRRAAPAPVKAPVFVAAPYSWTGFYVGVAVGGGWGSSAFTPAPIASTAYDLSGGLGVGTLGYNWQMGQLVFGIEGDLGRSNIRGSGACVGTNCDTANTWMGTIRGRVGYAVDRFMPYITGGAAFGNIRTSVTGVGSADDNKSGWTLGGGLEYAIAGPWTAKVEYLYVDLGRGGGIAGSDASFTANVVRAGLNYRF